MLTFLKTRGICTIVCVVVEIFAVSVPRMEDIWYCIHRTVQGCYVAQAGSSHSSTPPSALRGGTYGHEWLRDKLHEEHWTE